MTVDVFVSYSSKDKIIADTTVAALEQNQIRCWYAPRDIQSGKDWGKAITDAIDSSKVFLLIFSGNANQSQHVLDELNIAITNEITILPFRVENLQPDGAMRLHLTSRHWLDAFDPSWESNLKKLIQTVSATMETALIADDIKLPPTRKLRKTDQKNIWIRRIGVGVFSAALLIFAGWYGLTKLNTPEEILSSTELTEPTPEENPATTLSTSDTNSKLSDWKTIEFTVPGNGLWLEENGSYTAIGSIDTIVWSEDIFSGDIELSLELESSNSFTGASVILFGNGGSLASGNLIFTIASDQQGIIADSIYDNGHWLIGSMNSLNFVDQKHTVLISVLDRKASLFVDGVEIGTVFLDENINTSGKIGLLKYWEIHDISFSNIHLRVSE